MHTALIQGLQGVIAGETTPADFLAGLQKDWDAGH
jgi:hypothetical protein